MTSYDAGQPPTPPGQLAGGMSAAELLRRRDEYPAAARPPLMVLHPGASSPETVRCHHCGQPATVQWPRNATDDEREAHWAALEARIRAQPNLVDDTNATFTAARTELVFQAVFGCDEHQVPDMTLVHAADCGGHEACQCEGGSNGQR